MEQLEPAFSVVRQAMSGTGKERLANLCILNGFWRLFEENPNCCKDWGRWEHGCSLIVEEDNSERWNSVVAIWFLIRIFA
ncbi:unnamed protein product [Citrullus colocynthis]|uniref:Uncharacterized protein n=1 Tax=Citrullus colocynthis TaxID=252529 RepID=A0ABP0YAE6_9ROSI